MSKKQRTNKFLNFKILPYMLGYNCNKIFFLITNRWGKKFGHFKWMTWEILPRNSKEIFKFRSPFSNIEKANVFVRLPNVVKVDIFFIIEVEAFKPFNINPPWLYVEWQEVFSTYKLAYFPVSQHSQHATWSSIYNQPQYLRFKRYCHKSVLKYLSVWYSRTHVSRSMKYLFEIKRFKCLKIIKKYHFLLK